MKKKLLAGLVDVGRVTSKAVIYITAIVFFCGLGVVLLTVGGALGTLFAVMAPFYLVAAIIAFCAVELWRLGSDLRARLAQSVRPKRNEV